MKGNEADILHLAQAIEVRPGPNSMPLFNGLSDLSDCIGRIDKAFIELPLSEQNKIVNRVLSKLGLPPGLFNHKQFLDNVFNKVNDIAII